MRRLIVEKEPGLSVPGGHASSVHTEAVAMALPGPTLRRHWGVRLAAYAGAALFAVTASAVLFRIVSVEYLRYPVTGWFFLG